jgi:hypothetical protein
VTLAPGQSVRVRVTADTGALPAPGAYAASLTLTTDAPYLNSPVPVGLTVTARHGSAAKPGAARSAG